MAHDWSYVILTAGDEVPLAENVSRAMLAGWVLVGGPFAMPSGQLGQAMQSSAESRVEARAMLESR